MNIKILGPGCPNCEKTAKLVKQAVDEAGTDATIEKVSDFQEIAKMGVFSTPAVVIDGKIKCVGKVPSKKDIMAWLG